VIIPAKGIKKQVFGGVLFFLGAMTALLARIIGFELNLFYVVISIIGACFFLYGVIQNNRNKLTGEFQHADGFRAESDVTTGIQPHGTDTAAYANLPNQPATIRQRVSIHCD